ncbi:hypothetical protein [Pseudonocardia xishanensis]|uniref:Excreted virulence factor EspC (Type VII ESX diderm) n=1 Tax=Pseudonocardia xishanensis TaxID=630995 RepID=A0ABP8RL98_9PSEU
MTAPLPEGGFGVDTDLLLSHAADRERAATAVAAYSAPDPVAEDAFGLVGRVFAAGASAAAAAGAEALAGVSAEFRRTAAALREAAADYRAADTAVVTALGAVGRR